MYALVLYVYRRVRLIVIIVPIRTYWNLPCNGGVHGIVGHKTAMNANKRPSSTNADKLAAVAKTRLRESLATPTYTALTLEFSVGSSLTAGFCFVKGLVPSRAWSDANRLIFLSGVFVFTLGGMQI